MWCYQINSMKAGALFKHKHSTLALNAISVHKYPATHCTHTYTYILSHFLASACFHLNVNFTLQMKMVADQSVKK